MTVQRDYRPGDQPPEGYLAWHEWAAVQHKAKLKQRECPKCGRWKYPQELSNTAKKWSGKTARGKVVEFVALLCNDCAAYAA